MKLNKRILTFLMGMVYSFSSIAQDDYNPEFLIPYNDHGKWGFADTLGKVRVEPQFESVSFFYNSYGPMLSYVEKDGRHDYFVLGKGMCSPKGHESHPTLFHPFLFENNLSLVLKDEKLGLFDYGKQKLVIPAEYDDYIFDTLNEAVYLSKRDQVNKGNLIITSFEIKESTSERLSFSKIGVQPIREDDETQELILFGGKRDKWFQRVGDKWEKSEYTLVNGKKKQFEDPRIKVAAAGPTEKPTYEKVHRYRLVSMEGATLHSSIKLGNEQHFQVMHKPTGFGLTLNQSTILPFKYDFIDINYYDGFFYLFKDKKMGVHIPYTSYYTIEPKYDLVWFERTLNVSDKWQFALFNVKLGENEAYLGENGVEFFNFD